MLSLIQKMLKSLPCRVKKNYTKNASRYVKENSKLKKSSARNILSPSSPLFILFVRKTTLVSTSILKYFFSVCPKSSLFYQNNFQLFFFLTLQDKKNSSGLRQYNFMTLPFFIYFLFDKEPLIFLVSGRRKIFLDDK